MYVCNEDIIETRAVWTLLIPIMEIYQVSIIGDRLIDINQPFLVSVRLVTRSDTGALTIQKLASEVNTSL
jgi:hypothetical protein